MLVLNEVFAQTWEKQMEGIVPAAREFWTEAIALLPDFMWVAEVYWGREWELQLLGFQFTYDKRLYDRLRHATPQQVALHLQADEAFQGKLVRFLENHDEGRSAVVFGNVRLPAMGILMATLPGMRLYHQGQLAGKRIRIPVQLCRARTNPLMKRPSRFMTVSWRLPMKTCFTLGNGRCSLCVPPAMIPSAMS
jgi:hypothetical protein